MKNLQDTIADLSILYEISLNIGKTLDLDYEIQSFVKIIMSRKNYDYVSVWLKNEFNPYYELVYGTPFVNNNLIKIHSEHSLFSFFNDKDYYSLFYNDYDFESVLLEKNIFSGAVAVYKLEDIGFIRFYSSRKNEPFSNKELNQLREVVKKFSYSIKACIIYNKLNDEIVLRKKVVKSLIRAKTKVENAVKTKNEALISKIKAESENKAKTDFLANISHELRTPLNAIFSMANFLEKTGLKENQTEFVEILKNSSENLLFLIEQILDISKIESSSLILEIKPFLFHDLINKTISMIKLKIREKKLNLKVNIDSKIPKIIYGDMLRLQQILLNIFSNSIKFTEKGNIDFEVKLLSKKTDEAELLFILSDTGIGISEDKMKAVFDKFNQADNSITRKYGGAGLGLYITKQFIDLMKGNIVVEHNKPNGTIFKLFLKFNYSNDEKIFENIKTETETNENIKNVQPTDFDLQEKKYNILIAEDDKINQFVIKNLFKDYKNITYTIVDNGEEVCKLFKTNKFDLIIMDVNMPVMDGITAAKHIRDFEKSMNIQMPIAIIIVTATTIEQFRDKIKNIYINDFILKPIEPGKFYQKLNNVFKNNKNPEKYSDFSDESYNDENHLTDNKIIKSLIVILTEMNLNSVEVANAVNLLDNEIELYSVLVNQYLKDYHSIDIILLGHYNNNDNEKIKFISHKIVSASANIGAYKLSSLSKNFEEKLNRSENINYQEFKEYLDEIKQVNEAASVINEQLNSVY